MADEQPLISLGVDIGKSAHYAVAVDRDGETVYSTPVANDESALRLLVLWAKAHQAAVIVDQPGGTAALLLQLCWDVKIPLGYVPGLAMARARDFYAGESKTDPKDAFVLADVARAHPRRVVWLSETSGTRAQLELLSGYDADLRADANRVTNRLRALLATYWPAMERALDDRLDTIGGTALLKRYPSAPQIRQAGAKRLVALLRATHRVHQPEDWVEQLLVAARSQTVVVAGAETAASLVAELAEQLHRVLTRRQTLEKEIEHAFFGLPEASIVKSLPGIGPRLGTTILIEIGDIRQFRTPAQLAAYAGLGPTPYQSGTSVRGNKATRFGNHRLKNAFFLAAFSSLKHPPSRTYYDRKRAQGKRHNQAVLCLARRRVDVLHAMLTTGTLYHAPSSHTELESVA
ncbi:MAG: IS110 family transposase [Chloroflexota bacterium]|nr:IS110 family transposase [Chloroflexota bacterium]